MKRASKILCIILVAILIVAMIIINNVNAETVTFEANVSGAVEKNNTFTVTIKSEEKVFNFIQIVLNYNTGIFECVNITDENGEETWSFNENKEGNSNTCSFPSDNIELGTKPSKGCKLTFKVLDQSENNSGTIAIESSNASEKDTGNPISFDTPNPIEITINQETEEKIKPELSLSKNTIKVNETVNVSVNNSDKVVINKWESDNTSVATVDENGTIRGIAPGSATITATAENGESASVSITVENSGSDPDQNKFSLDKYTVYIKVNESQNVKASKNVSSWESSDSSIVSVEKVNETECKITGISKGVTGVTAYDENHGYLGLIQVEVSESNEPNNGGDNNTGNPDNNGDNPDNGDNQGGGQNPGNGGSSDEGSSSQPENPPGSSSSGPSYSSSKGPSTPKPNASSSADEAVPATGESSVGTIIILAIVTLIVASVIFKRKCKVK